MIFIATISQPKKISIFNKRTSVKIVVAILLCLFLCPILISTFSSYPFFVGTSNILPFPTVAAFSSLSRPFEQTTRKRHFCHTNPQ